MEILLPGQTCGLISRGELRSSRVDCFAVTLPGGNGYEDSEVCLARCRGISAGLSSWHDWPLRPTEPASCSLGDPWRGYGGPLLVVKINRMMWRKSSMSGPEGCVEVAAAKGSILVRDSKAPHGPILKFSGSEWTRFLAACTRTKLDES